MAPWLRKEHFWPKELKFQNLKTAFRTNISLKPTEIRRTKFPMKLPERRPEPKLKVNRKRWCSIPKREEGMTGGLGSFWFLSALSARGHTTSICRSYAYRLLVYLWCDSGSFVSSEWAGYVMRRMEIGSGWTPHPSYSSPTGWRGDGLLGPPCCPCPSKIDLSDLISLEPIANALAL